VVKTLGNLWRSWSIGEGSVVGKMSCFERLEVRSGLSEMGGVDRNDRRCLEAMDWLCKRWQTWL